MHAQACVCLYVGCTYMCQGFCVLMNVSLCSGICISVHELCAYVMSVCACVYICICLFLPLPPLSSLFPHPSWSASPSLICDLAQEQSTELPRPSQGWLDLSPWYHALFGFSPWTQPGSSTSGGLILSCEDRTLALINSSIGVRVQVRGVFHTSEAGESTWPHFYSKKHLLYGHQDQNSLRCRLGGALTPKSVLGSSHAPCSEICA